MAGMSARVYDIMPRKNGANVNNRGQSMFNYFNVYVIKYKTHSKERGWARQIYFEYSILISVTE